MRYFKSLWSTSELLSDDMQPRMLVMSLDNKCFLFKQHCKFSIDVQDTDDVKKLLN